MILPATRADVPAVRLALADLPPEEQPYLPADRHVAQYWDAALGNVALMGDNGEFAQAHWSAVNKVSTVVFLLPEAMGIGTFAPLLVGLLDALWDTFPACRARRVEATFRHGKHPVTGLEDFGESKANAWADFTALGGGARPNVKAVYHPITAQRFGTLAGMPLAQARARLRQALP